MDDLAPPPVLDAVDDGLALVGDGPRRWIAHPDKRYWNAIGPWGGWTAALLLKAVLAEPDHAGSPVAMTINLMGGLDDSPLTIETRAVRQGRSMEFWTSELVQNGQPVAMAMITLGARRDTVRMQDAVMPQAPAPETIPTRPAGPIPFLSKFDLKPVEGMVFPIEGDNTRSVAWIHGQRTLDAVLLTALSDVFPPRILHRSKEMRPVSTVTMSIYFHGTPEELAEVGDDWILSDANARRFEAGFFDQHGGLWSRDGKLLATTEQLCWFK